MPDIETPRSAELGGGADQGAESAQGLPGRIQRYGVAKGRAVEMIAHLGEQDDPHATRVMGRLVDCGNWLHFRHYFTVDKVRLHAASFCKQHLVCPLCAIRRGAKMLKAYLDRFRVIQAERPELQAYLVTLTVQNGDDLAERFGHLRRSLTQLLKRRHRAKARSELKNWAGAFYSQEITNKGKGWHPHVHMIVLADRKPSWQRLRDEWHQITGDSYVVDVSRREGQEDTELFLEVCKYALKFSDLSLADNWQAAQLLHGKRLVGSFGCFRGVEVPPELVDEPLDDLPFIDLFYRYLHGKGYEFQPAASAADRVA